jgi:hypothetical protein
MTSFAILVPDFGQTKFDNAILNLEPFEQRLMKNFLQKELIYSTLEIYFTRRIGEHLAPRLQSETTEFCKFDQCRKSVWKN